MRKRMESNFLKANLWAYRHSGFDGVPLACRPEHIYSQNWVLCGCKNWSLLPLMALRAVLNLRLPRRYGDDSIDRLKWFSFTILFDTAELQRYSRTHHADFVENI
jgi:hypothetical protein